MLSGETITQLLGERVGKSGAKVAQRYKQGGRWHDVTWDEYGRAVREIAQGLRAAGVGKGQRVAILCQTRPEWTWADHAILSLGAATVPIYPSSLPDQCQYILENSEACALFVENAEQLAKYQKIAGKVPGVRLVVTCQGELPAGDEKFVAFDVLRERGRAYDKENAGAFGAGIAEVHPDDLATLVYTSGTTGNPKGVMLTHKNFVAAVRGASQVVGAAPGDVALSFLPLAHIFARVEHLAVMYNDCQSAFAESLDAIMENLGEIRPTLLFSVPRIFERAYAKILSGAEEGSALKRALFGWAVDRGARVLALRQQNQESGGLLALEFKIADVLVFSKVREKLGMTRLRYAVSGGAPLSKKIAEFFGSLGVLILEGYGLTETAAASFINKPGHYKFGTVGPAVPGVEARIAADGEILLRGDSVFEGYYRNEEATKEAIVEGWFHTGDIGELDADGFLKITDRKKDLIVTAGGKNISPQNIENLLKTDRHVSQVMVFGDRRKYLTALITMNIEEVKKWAATQGIEASEPQALCQELRVKEFFGRIVEEKNQQLASYETIKKFSLIPGDFTVEGGQLTPTLKVKRKVVTSQYKGVLDSMYDPKDIID